MKPCKTIDAFLKTVADAISDQDLLCLYLQYSEREPQKLANEMIAYYGSIANLLDTNPFHVKLTFSLSDETVALLQLLPALRRRYLRIRACTDEYLIDDDAIARYLLPLFSGEADEVLYMICMDDHRKVLGYTRLNTGDINSVQVSNRILAAEALVHNASVIVLAHNHPSGESGPSKVDVSNTSALRDSLAPLGIHLLDHFIVANDRVQGIRHSCYLANTSRFPHLD